MVLMKLLQRKCKSTLRHQQLEDAAFALPLQEFHQDPSTIVSSLPETFFKVSKSTLLHGIPEQKSEEQGTLLMQPPDSK